MRFLGVVLMALGALNAMLAWRGALPERGLALVILVAGACVFAIGAARDRKSKWS